MSKLNITLFGFCAFLFFFPKINYADPFSKLPDEVLVDIFKTLDPQSARMAAKVNQQFRRSANDKVVECKMAEKLSEEQKSKSLIQAMQSNHQMRIACLLEAGTDPVELGIKYYLGNGVEKNVALARELLLLGSKTGKRTRTALHNLGVIWREEGADQDFEKARQSFESAAEQGNLDSRYNLALLLDKGLGGPKDSVKAGKLVKLNADLGHVISQNTMGSAYSKGILGFEKNFELARYYFQLAANQEDPEAIFNLAQMHYHGRGGPVDMNQARLLFHAAAEAGDVDAMHEFAEMQYLGLGGPQSHQVARHVWSMAAQRGSVRSFYTLGIVLKNGEGGPQDLVGARRYLEMAAKQGHTPSKICLFRMFYFGNGVSKNLPLAREYVKSGAKDGDAESMFNYALMLHRGEGGPKNFSSALKWMQRSANAGDEDAVAGLRELEVQGAESDNDNESISFNMPKPEIEGDSISENED